jgi:magnesium transporter
MAQETILYDDIATHLRALSAVREPATVETGLRRMLDRLSNRQVAEALFVLSDQEIANLVARLSDETVGELLAELDPTEGAQLLLRLTRVRAADVLEEMDPDDAADLVAAVGAVDEQAAEDLLTEMQPAEAGDVRGLLAYPPESAGGIMTTTVATVRPDMTAAEAQNAIRRLAAEERTETIYYLYVTGTDRRLLGVLSLRELMLAPPAARIAGIMRRSFATVQPETDQEEAARLLTEKHLLALPVVDAERRLLGIVTVDDVADVVEEEATEDFHRTAAIAPLRTSYRETGILSLYRRRIVWLGALIVANLVSSSVIAAYEETLAAAIALAFFIPLLIDSGGNVGSQAATLMVRAIATGDLALRQWLQTVGKELAVGIALGATMGLGAAGLGLLRGGPEIGLVVGLTMVSVVLVANIIGTSLPFILTRLRLDPAVASSPLITTLADATGLIIYFSIAVVVLDV